MKIKITLKNLIYQKDQKEKEPQIQKVIMEEVLVLVVVFLLDSSLFSGMELTLETQEVSLEDLIIITTIIILIMEMDNRFKIYLIICHLILKVD